MLTHTEAEPEFQDIKDVILTNEVIGLEFRHVSKAKTTTDMQ